MASASMSTGTTASGLKVRVIASLTMTNKHDHISGRPRDYISDKYFYRGRHRGVYKPSRHWEHVKCYPNGTCLIGIHDVKLTPYVDASGNNMLAPGKPGSEGFIAIGEAW
jgi:hypothetical protein